MYFVGPCVFAADYESYKGGVYLLSRSKQICKTSLKMPRDNQMSYIEEGQISQWKRKKRTNNDLQSIAQKTKDRATQSPLKPVVNSCSPEGKAVPAPHVAPVVQLLFQTRS
jgi:hypothetical protein